MPADGTDGPMVRAQLSRPPCAAETQLSHHVSRWKLFPSGHNAPCDPWHEKGRLLNQLGAASKDQSRIPIPRVKDCRYDKHTVVNIFSPLLTTCQYVRGTWCSGTVFPNRVDIHRNVRRDACGCLAIVLQRESNRDRLSEIDVTIMY